MPVLSKPYVITDASRQSEDIDRMFDDVYTEMAELEREQAESGTVAGGNAQGVPGRDGDEPDAPWPLVVLPSALPLEYTITTTGNIDDLDFGNVALLRMNNASLATIRGLKAGRPGQVLVIMSVGGGQVDLAHQDTGSAAANRLLNFVTGAPISLAADAGRATYYYSETEARWMLHTHEQGAPIDVAFAAGNYNSGGTAVWTVDAGDQLTYSYTLRGRNLLISLNLASITLAAGGTGRDVLRVTYPSTFQASSVQLGCAVGSDNATATIMNYRTPTGVAYFEIRLTSGANWATSTDATNIAFIGEIGIT